MSGAQVHSEEEAWVRRERDKVVAYLASQHCDHGGVGEWPAFHVDPYVALWAIQSRTVAGRIGWWAISGDLPTDYMSSSSGYHPREALRYFSSQWLGAAESMQRGEEHSRTEVGTPEYADDDSLWEE